MDKAWLMKAWYNLKLLIEVILFVVVFKLAFGESNTLIGVTTVTAYLMFMPYNLSVTPAKFFGKILFLNLLMGLGGFIASYNIYLALIINFFVVYMIAYGYYNSFRMEMYFPFTLQYAFILFNPINIANDPSIVVKDLLIRLAALCICPIIVVGYSVYKHRDYASKRIKNITNLIDQLILEVEGKENQFETTIANLKLSMFDYKADKSANSYKNNIIINAIETLGNIYYHLNNYNDSDRYILINYLNQLKAEASSLSDITKFDTKDISNINLRNNITIIDNNIKYINKKISITDKAKEFIEQHTYTKAKKNTGKVKRYAVEQSFAIKIAIAVSLISFISDFFHFPDGKWAVFTVISVMTPLFEKSVQKMKYRLLATIAGLFALMVIFSIFRDSTIRLIILMLANYIHMFQTQYKYKIILVTFSAVGMLMVNDPISQEIMVFVSRLVMIMVGLFIGILFNRFVFKYTLHDSIKYDLYRYLNCLEEIYADVKVLAKEKVEDHKINTRILIPNLANNNINKSIIECESNGRYTTPITPQCFEITNYLFHYYLCIKNKLISQPEIDKIIKEVDKLGTLEYDELPKLHQILTTQQI